MAAYISPSLFISFDSSHMAPRTPLCPRLSWRTSYYYIQFPKSQKSPTSKITIFSLQWFSTCKSSIPFAFTFSLHSQTYLLFLFEVFMNQIRSPRVQLPGFHNFSSGSSFRYNWFAFPRIWKQKLSSNKLKWYQNVYK